uniref:Uncharacterized protein n=2 Tax=Candidatus Kentrum eta TaxID=2126337 RepID=A0A450VJQ2_9GAMM|nr:MAG: hypothetical protein BECKH772B_GA0070898_105262 [Candidatus Kentron sp. H]VFK05091.1 MAG: hypothetical protein BECKH772A_GA0070896_105032 [Candidatus Kentron sp. H]VFK08307.1 MAG: hypothetical protein BECKH772C_GA0070978_105022 [Candidatus Kentron sp. H]
MIPGNGSVRNLRLAFSYDDQFGVARNATDPSQSEKAFLQQKSYRSWADTVPSRQGRGQRHRSRFDDPLFSQSLSSLLSRINLCRRKIQQIRVNSFYLIRLLLDSRLVVKE